MAERRTPYEIYWEILAFCKTPRAFTAIINRCDLNSRSGQEYIEFLCKRGYLSRISEGESQIFYNRTGHRISLTLLTIVSGFV